MALLTAVAGVGPPMRRRLKFPVVMPSLAAMKRMLIWIGFGVLALLLAGYFGATIFLGSIVTTGVNRFAPSITQTPVHLEGARLSPLSGSGIVARELRRTRKKSRNSCVPSPDFVDKFKIVMAGRTA